MSSTILVTGAGGWLGSLIAEALHSDPTAPNTRLILADVVKPKAPAGSNALVIQADLTDRAQVNALFTTSFGIPNTVYCMHGIMSRGSEENFELGIKVNVDSVRLLLEETRSVNAPKPIKFIFTSSLAVYGGPLRDIITPETIAVPQSSYGTAKLMAEIMINEYTRRGWVDGRIMRLPTITVRPGPPAAATSAFISGIIREPLSGVEATCPIGDSYESPELSLPLWLASPETTIKNLILARHIPAERFMAHTRVVCLPGFTATIKDELEALVKVAGKEALQLVKFVDDPVSRRIVSSWPSVFDNTYALSLGFVADEGGMEPIVRRFQQSVVKSDR
ncbi:hypothetical protein D9613_009289 [Agrocybe pediades]|uniref:NAD-dependent epimerase/dehydratase domain-containing protein n=1 Tax=Agrocybe pediades TaxID=84607 RepID=A0A8H4R606_9AGAR|nr:hypothetical protein D9613_009289 [Agrocybe pediades]